MATLLIDTALEGILVAVGTSGNTILAEESSSQPYGQAEILLPMVERVLAAAGVSYQDLTRLGVTIGPGAFTGLRVGISCARAIAMLLKIPTVGMTTFDAIRRTSGYEQEALILIETKRQDYYVQTPDREMLVLGGQEISARWPDLPLIGNAVDRYQQEIGRFVPNSMHVNRISAAALNACVGEGETGVMEPLYLRPADVTMPKK